MTTPVSIRVATHLPGRDWAVNKVSWLPARNGLKYGVHLAAYPRATLLAASGRMPAITNVFAASCPKAGSQWVKALLHHPVVRAHTGLFTLPQLDYRIRTRPFPKGTFVPGMYVSYPAYRAIPKRGEHRTIYIFRDPRDIVVSAYFSTLETHRYLPDTARARTELADMDIERGLMHTVEICAPYIRDMATWVDVDDPALITLRLEDIKEDREAAVSRILQHCGVRLSGAELATVLSETSREALQAKDLAARRPGSESHYRTNQQGFRDLFTSRHYAAVDELAPGLVATLGYPD